jgi:hypothetical protein
MDEVWQKIQRRSGRLGAKDGCCVLREGIVARCLLQYTGHVSGSLPKEEEKRFKTGTFALLRN